jgi:pimeloyl-ACP methyl ester carboxylesterase
MPEIYDHAGNPVRHGRARVNGIRMHYVTAGQGEPLLLLHGTPKTHYYWYKLRLPHQRRRHGGADDVARP